jgi:hypothetical protein
MQFPECSPPVERQFRDESGRRLPLRSMGIPDP